MLAATTISASGTGGLLKNLAQINSLVVMVNVSAVPSGGAPTLDVYLQVSPDLGDLSSGTWRDIANFQFTGSTLKKFYQISGYAAGATTVLATSDGALASNTVVQGPLMGDRVRLKWTFAAGGSTGTYTMSAIAFIR